MTEPDHDRAAAVAALDAAIAAAMTCIDALRATRAALEPRDGARPVRAEANGDA